MRIEGSSYKIAVKITQGPIARDAMTATDGNHSQKNTSKCSRAENKASREHVVAEVRGIDRPWLAMENTYSGFVKTAKAKSH